jgi:hypothetical protein
MRHLGEVHLGDDTRINCVCFLLFVCFVWWKGKRWDMFVRFVLVTGFHFHIQREKREKREERERERAKTYWRHGEAASW